MYVTLSRELARCWVVLVFELMSCKTSTSAAPPPDAELVDEPYTFARGASSDSEGARGALVTPEFFEFVTRWSEDSLVTSAVLSTQPDLITYARAKAPQLVDEAIRVTGIPVANIPIAHTNATGCSCSILGTFSSYQETTLTGQTWSANHKGLAHHAHIAQSGSGAPHEDAANLVRQSVQLLTRMLCVTPQGSACVASCSAQLSTDVQYSSTAIVESHTDAGFPAAATTQVSDGTTFDLRLPAGAPTLRLFEKAMSVQQSVASVTFPSGPQASSLKSGLGISVPIETATKVRRRVS